MPHRRATFPPLLLALALGVAHGASLSEGESAALAAWEAAVAASGTFEKFEADGEGRWQVSSAALEYDGPLVVDNLVLTPVPNYGADPGYDATAHIAYRLGDLLPDAPHSLARNRFLYRYSSLVRLTDSGDWITFQDWEESAGNGFLDDAGAAWWILEWIPWILIIGGAAVILYLGKSARRTVAENHRIMARAEALQNSQMEQIERSRQVEQEILRLAEAQLAELTRIREEIERR